MKATELRIGNLIQDAKGSSFEVIGKDIHDIEVFTSNQERVFGIPLTPEWLERFGFVNNGVMWSNENDMVIDYDLTWIGIHMERQLDDVEFDLPRHVHSLQNLIFALTGQELELKQ